MSRQWGGSILGTMQYFKLHSDIRMEVRREGEIRDYYNGNINTILRGSIELTGEVLKPELQTKVN